MGFPKTHLGDKAKRAKPGIPLDKQVISELLKKYFGNLSRIADAMGTTRLGLRNRINSDPELKAELEQARERYVDELEESVWERAIESKDSVLQIFLLKTQGRNRGYEQSEAQNTAKDIATAAFDFIVNKSKNPAESVNKPTTTT